MFYWAYLQSGLAGSWDNLGSLTQPITHSSTSTMLLGLNYFLPLLHPNPDSEQPLRLRVVATWTRPSFIAIKTSLLLASFTFEGFKPPSKQINHQSWTGKLKRKRLSRQLFKLVTAKFCRLTKLLSIWEKLSYTLKCISENDHNFKESLALIQSHSSQSSSPPLPASLSLFFILSIPLTRSLDPTPLFFSVSAPFLRIRSMFCYHSSSNLSPPPLFSLYLC